MSSLRKILATGLGTGYLPIAPGSWASAAVAGIFIAVAFATGGNPYWLCAAMAAVLLLASAGCVRLGPFAEKQWAGSDPRRCTLDEWAGQALALVALPTGAGPRGWLVAAAAGFVAFRIFDIIKPPPARRLEKLPAGWGILADDLVAGVYANAAAQLAVTYAVVKLF
ncbi:MAG: phosphatidylglycerophosphatase A family protein [Planctomycetota bacterium]|jgi:phosphatidylglycerophosphatase A